MDDGLMALLDPKKILPRDAYPKAADKARFESRFPDEQPPNPPGASASTPPGRRASLPSAPRARPGTKAISWTKTEACPLARDLSHVLHAIRPA